MKIKKANIAHSDSSIFVKALIVLVFLYAILYFYRLGSIGLLDVDEPRYAEAGREMLESGNWVVPYFNYEVRFDKPVFFYWLEALSMKFFGVNEFSVRFPSVISAFLTLALLFYFLKQFYSLSVALSGVLILMSCFEFAALSRFSITDMTLSAFVSSSLICFFLGYSQIATSHRFFKNQLTEFSLFYVLGFIFLGLAVLTKGPVAVVVVGLVLFPFFWWIGKIDYFVKSFSFWLGFLIFLLITLPWYCLVHVATNGDFTKVFFSLHNISRYTSVVSGHKGSLLYFIPVVLIGTLPWTFFIPQAVGNLLKKGLRTLLGSVKEQVPWFCLWWFIVVFLFFTLSKTKLLTYVLPLFLPLSVIISLWFNEVISRGIGCKGLIIGLGIFFLFCIIMMYLCMFNLNILLPREVKSLKLDFFLMAVAFFMLVGVSMAWASSHKDQSMTLLILLSTFLLLYFSLINFLLPKIDSHSQYKLRTFAKSVPKDVEILTYQIIKPSLTFYSKRKVTKIDSLKRLQKKLNEDRKVVVVTKKKLLNGVVLDNYYEQGSDYRYIFFANFPSNE